MADALSDALTEAERNEKIAARKLRDGDLEGAQKAQQKSNAAWARAQRLQ